MESTKKMKIVEKCRVAPMSPVASPAPACLPLTFFDLVFLRFPPTQRLFFYELPSHLSTAMAFSETVLPKLKHSLSLALQNFPLLAGNLAWSQDSARPVIEYFDGDAVSLTVTESGSDFHHLSDKSSFREAKEYHPHLPDLPASHEKVPVLALQVILFPNSGFSVGYSAHHAVMDGKTAAMFMNSWASICSSSNRIADEPFYGRASLSEDLERAVLNHCLNQGGPNNKSLMFLDMKSPADVVFATFQLTQANIETIKNWVTARWEMKNQKKNQENHVHVHLSSFTAICAFVWVCLIKVRGLGIHEKVEYWFTVDCRARLDPPVPSTYFGNCLVVCFSAADVGDLVGDDGVAMAAKAIGEAINDLKHGVPKAAEDTVRRLSSVEESMIGKVISIAGSPHLELYRLDFGWGRPRKVEVISIDKSGAFSLSDSRDGAGTVDIGVALKKDDVASFASFFTGGLEAFQSS